MPAAAWLLNLGFAGSIAGGPVPTPIPPAPSDMRVETTAEVSQFEIVGAPPGLAVLQAAGRNGPGVGRLQVIDKEAQWRAPGSANFGPAVDVSAGGTFHLYDGDDPDKWLRVESYASLLPEGGASAAVYLADRYETIYSAPMAWSEIAGPDVTAAEALAGHVEEWSFKVANRNADYAIQDLVAWLDPAVTWIEIAAAPGGPWVAPTTEAAGLALGDVGADSTVTVYVRRTVPALTASDPSILVLFHFAWNAF